jgi:hypothetical protein
MALGVIGGAAVGWLIGRTIYFFEVELPYRDLHLPPGQLQAAACGISTVVVYPLPALDAIGVFTAARRIVNNERNGIRARIICVESNHKFEEVASRPVAVLPDRLLFDSAAAIVAR